MELRSYYQGQTPDRVTADAVLTSGTSLRLQRIDKLKRSCFIGRNIICHHTFTTSYIPHVVNLARKSVCMSIPLVMIHRRVLRNTCRIFELQLCIELTATFVSIDVVDEEAQGLVIFAAFHALRILHIYPMRLFVVFSSRSNQRIPYHPSVQAFTIAFHKELVHITLVATDMHIVYFRLVIDLH